MKEQHKFVLVSMVSGILSGIAVAMALPYLAENQIVAHHPVSIRNTADDVATVGIESNKEMNRDQLRQNQARLQQMEQRLSQLASTLNLNSGAADDFEAKALELGKLTPEEAKAADLNWWEETKIRFEREEVDTQWAEATNQLFKSDIAGLAEGSGFSMLHTECHSTQCSAVLEWPSYGEATLGYAKLLHHPYQANCAGHTLLPEPSDEDADQPYQMTIIFDCSEWRVQG
jgi:hypothetical protein